MTQFKATFHESEQSFKSNFGKVNVITSGDYAEIYEAGRKAGIGQGIEQGISNERKRFWDNFQDYGNRTNWPNAFYKWTDEIFTPQYDIVAEYNHSMFSSSRITNLELLLKRAGKKIIFRNDSSGYVAMTYTFYGMSDCTAIGNFEIVSEVSQYTYTFWGMYLLKEITSPLSVNETTTFDNVFTYNRSLEEVRFKGVIGQKGLDFSGSVKLSKASWQNIIGCLSSTASGLSISGSLASVNSAFETSPGANDGVSSEEWKALISTKPNCTINLR